jgi:hypothetical protein
MSTDLITGQATAVANIPAYAQGDSGLGDLGGESFPRLTFKGSRFRVKKGADEQVLEDFALDVVILAANPTVSRVYYDGPYSEDSTGQRPMCASADGEVPLPTVSQPQSNACATCPMNEKGSQISDDGGKRKACSYFHRTVLRLVKYPDLGELACEIKAMSLFGESYPDVNKLNFRMYADRLNSHQTMAHAVITQMTFDVDSSVPKVLFQPIGYVTEADFVNVYDPLAKSEAVLAMADTSSVRTGNEGGGDAQSNQFKQDLMAGAAAPGHAQIAGPTLEDQLATCLGMQDYEGAAKVQAVIKSEADKVAAAMQEPAPVPSTASIMIPPTAEPVKTAAEQQIEALQAQIDAMNNPPPAEVMAPPEPAPPPETEEAKKIRLLQEQIATMQGKVVAVAPVIPPAVAESLATTAVVAQTNGAAAPALPGAEVNAHGVAWNPEFHSTSSATGAGALNADGHWKAKRGISAELKARVKMPTGGAPVQVPPAAAAIAPVAAAAVATPPVPPPPAATAQVEGAAFDDQLDAALAEFDA